MAIVEDKARNRYYISYHLTYPNGDRKTVNIKNKEWSFSKVGKRYMKAIEADEIEKDRAKRLKEFSLVGREASFGAFCDGFLKEQGRTLRRGTAYSKECIVRKYIIPHFKEETEVGKALTATNCRLFKDSVWATELTTQRKGRVLRVLREAISFGADNDVITYEDAKKLNRVLSAPRASVQEKAEHQFWTPEEYQAFRDSFSSEEDWKWGVMFDVIYYGALRLGEALALKWKWVDFSKNSIFIDKSVDPSGVESGPKNSSSRASVSLPSAIMEELSALKGALYASDDEYVFFGRHMVSRTNLRRKMDSHIAKAGVKKIRVHDLRHSMASRLINMGMNPLIVSKHLRHSSTQQTLDTYSHLFPTITEGFMEQLGVSVPSLTKRTPK